MKKKGWEKENTKDGDPSQDDDENVMSKVKEKNQEKVRNYFYC